MSDDEKKLRLFLAFEIPDTLRTKLAALEKYLARYKVKGRFVKPESMHVTLKFLGWCEPDMPERLQSAMEKVAAESPAMHLTATGLGVFPNENRPRVLWTGLAGDSGHVVALANRVEDATEQLGFEREKRPFHPHLTLARFKTRVSPKALRQALEQWDGHEFESFRVEDVVLFRSHLGSGGAKYEALERFSLG